MHLRHHSPHARVRYVFRHLSNLPSDYFIGMGETQTGVCHLENISGIVLEKVVEYFYYNEKHKESSGVPDMEIPSELCLELLMAADYLDT